MQIYAVIGMFLMLWSIIGFAFYLEHVYQTNPKKLWILILIGGPVVMIMTLGAFIWKYLGNPYNNFIKWLKE